MNEYDKLNNIKRLYPHYCEAFTVSDGVIKDNRKYDNFSNIKLDEDEDFCQLFCTFLNRIVNEKEYYEDEYSRCDSDANTEFYLREALYDKVTENIIMYEHMLEYDRGDKKENEISLKVLKELKKEFDYILS